MKKTPLKAFLLSAGLGTRLRPLTDETPKCLLPINGKPLMQIWLELLTYYGIEEVLVNTHWHHDKVEAFLAKWPRDRLTVIPYYEPDLLGSAGTLLANRHWVEDGAPFFILYGDNLTDVNLQKILAFHTAHNLSFTLGVFVTDTPKSCGIARVDQDGLVTDFEEKPKDPKSNLAAAGIYVADKNIFNFFPKIKAHSLKTAALPNPLDLGFHIIPQMVGLMKAYLIKEFLMDIGTLSQYEKAKLLWREVRS